MARRTSANTTHPRPMRKRGGCGDGGCEGVGGGPRGGLACWGGAEAIAQRVGQRRVASTADARSGTERAPRGTAPGGGAAAPAGAPAAARRAAGGARGGRRRGGRSGGDERRVVLLVPVVALVVGVAPVGPACARARGAGAGGGD